MATNYYTLKGKVKWAKVYEPDEYSGAKRWLINFYPENGSEWEKFSKTGLTLKVKEDEDGKYVTLRRPCNKLIKDNLVIFAPPEISGAFEVKYRDQDGNIVRSYNKGEGVTAVTPDGEQIPIGNGTVVLVNFAAYDTVQGKGHRLENIKVLDLVSYEKPEEKVKEEAEEEKPPVKQEKKKKDEDLNDEIPW